MNIQNTDLGNLFPLALGSVWAADKWKEEGVDKVFDTYVYEGGNVLDAARVYTELGDCEPTIGRWLKNSKKRDEVIIVGKGGHPDLSTMHISRLSREEMTSDLDNSLIDLGTDFIDIYLYHRDDISRTVEELIETMESFVKAGKIRYYGVSNWTLPRMKEAVEYCKNKGYRGPVMNEAFFNAATEYSGPLYDPTLIKIDKEMQDYHKSISQTDHDILAAGYSSICGGFFHQYITGGESAVKDKTFLSEENIKIAEEIRRKTIENNTTITQEVLAFFKTLDFPCLALFHPRNSAGLLEAMKVWK